MAGRFEGVSDLEWRLFEDVFPPAPPRRGRGMPHAPFRKILNTLLGLDHGVGHLRPLSLTRQRACWHIMTLQ